MVESRQYSTRQVAPKDRFAFWADAVCASFVRLGCEAPQTTDFSGDLDLRRFPGLTVSHVSGGAHSVVRRQSDIRSETDDYFLVSLQTRNTSRITQFGNTALLQPGDMAIYDSTQPYLIDLGDGFAKTVIQLPRERLLARLPLARMMGGQRIDGQSGIGKLVRENILTFAETMDGRDPAVTALLQDIVIDLVATGLASVADGHLDLASPEQLILIRARSYISDTVTDPELNRSKVAEHIGLSVRRLNDIFAKDGSSISEEIRRQRLERVAADLRDPRLQGLSISEIAMRCGYENLQHFSTLFRSAHGVSPRAWRAGEG
ncbi:helix-turn-helix domain-containing protein [Pararhodobacter sp.]|uniref:AraC-like ligand-binding domain-containing protein n=1 Tax=Pararhodobacter sp. TaxID=2127056 RepID=UPI002AFFC465|nr:helix-turn-helix domain-containing protein [Pararhodobacter sp.]